MPINFDKSLKSYFLMVLFSPVICLSLISCAPERLSAYGEMGLRELCFTYNDLVLEQKRLDAYNADKSIIKIATFGNSEKRNFLAEYEAEIRSRDFFTDAEWALIKSQKIQIGQRAEILPCAFGRPSKVNRTVNQYGVSEQWVFRSTGWYVYTDDGVITSWQN
ncbi:MAG: hypothetical protein ISQ26_06825 [Candidatus Puniceispirillum sp.]|nr:hypothetical protein [Candidatus Puniceispirillum sp.]